MTNLKGKKLLILAASPHEIDLVQRAKELGVYTIVTDYYDEKISPAKQIADEAWSISWSDLDALEEKCREKQIDGITAGYSEFTVECLIKLCNRLNLPCYINEEQLNITRDKILFKNECRKNGVPTIKEYPDPDSVDEFPVIVKPVDRSGSIGISIATNRGELNQAYQYAMEMSVCKKVIIEKFISKGTKFDACYAISQGEVHLLVTSDTINAANNGTDKVVQSAWFLPSKYHDQFVEQVNPNVIKMIQEMDIKDGFIFYSGFADGESFTFFETGFRLGGGHMHTFAEAKNYPNIHDIFIYHALTGDTSNINLNCDTRTDLKGVILNFYAKSGVFSHYKGMDQIAKNKLCYMMLPMCYRGKECTDDKAILTKLAMIHLYDTEPIVLSNIVKHTYETFEAVDINGNDMIFDRIDSEPIQTWWNK